MKLDNLREASYVCKDNKPKRLSLKEINRHIITKAINTERASKSRECKINRNNILKICKMEHTYEVLALNEGVYYPRLSYKMLDNNNGYIILYNVNMFRDEDGVIRIPEGISVICSNNVVECKGIKFPKSLSCIVSLNLRCKERVNLRNVRYISNLVVDAKELLLPYTLERIESNGLVLLGKTILKSERTPKDTKIKIGSLGQNAIIDKRDETSVICLSNRFCNLFDNSLPNLSCLFLEINCEDSVLIDEMFISNYYPSYLNLTE